MATPSSDLRCAFPPFPVSYAVGFHSLRETDLSLSILCFSLPASRFVPTRGCNISQTCKCMGLDAVYPTTCRCMSLAVTIATNPPHGTRLDFLGMGTNVPARFTLNNVSPQCCCSAAPGTAVLDSDNHAVVVTFLDQPPETDTDPSQSSSSTDPSAAAAEVSVHAGGRIIGACCIPGVPAVLQYPTSRVPLAHSVTTSGRGVKSSACMACAYACGTTHTAAYRCDCANRYARAAYPGRSGRRCHTCTGAERICTDGAERRGLRARPPARPSHAQGNDCGDGCACASVRRGDSLHRQHSTWHATCNTGHVVRNMQHGTWYTPYSTARDLTHTTCDVAHTAAVQPRPHPQNKAENGFYTIDFMRRSACWVRVRLGQAWLGQEEDSMIRHRLAMRPTDTANIGKVRPDGHSAH